MSKLEQGVRSQESGVRISRRHVFCGLAAGFLPALAKGEDSRLMSDDTRRVAGHLACLCRSCKNTVGDCPMLDCSYCSKVRPRIAEMLKAGKSDQAIIDAFVSEEGKEALAAPPTEGFSLLAWSMPGVAALLGLGGVYLAIQRLRRPLAAAPEIDPAALDRYHEEIEKDLSKLE